MIMLLVQNPAMAVAISIVLQQRHAIDKSLIDTLIVGAAPTKDRCVVEFHNLADAIDVELARSPALLRSSLLVFTDLYGYRQIDKGPLNPVHDNGWCSILGMLILAYPEVHWILLGKPSEEWPLDGKLCTADNLAFDEIFQYRDAGFSPLFDASGLRTEVRKSMNDLGKERQYPVRESAEAAAIDEETDFAFFHAYVAYRFGYRSHVVTTRTMMNLLFKNEDKVMSLVFEDLFLNFADGLNEGLSDLSGVRDNLFPALNKAHRRIFVTSGHAHGLPQERRRKNNAYLRDLRSRTYTQGKDHKEELSHYKNATLPKPLGGMFRLWSDAGMKSRSSGEFMYAERFKVPKGRSKQKGFSSSGHSTPGRILEICTRLLDRAERILETSINLQSSVYGAVLATDALEILCGRTPTASLRSLAAKHQLEASAECQFLGIEGTFDVKSRLKELKNDISSLGDWYRPNVHQFAEWNAESAVVRRMIRIFRKNNQFDEEQMLQVRERQLHRRIWFKRKFRAFGDRYRLINPIYWAAAYVDLLLRSMSILVLATVSWIFLLAFLYAVTSNWGDADPIVGGFLASVTSFIGVSAPATGGDIKNHLSALVALALISGFIHLGVLISHLYVMASRR